MNAIIKIFLVSLIIVRTMHASESEMPLMRSAAPQNNYGSGKSAVKIFAQDASAVVVSPEKIAEIQLRIDALHEEVKQVRLEVDAMGKKIVALGLQSK